MSKPQTPDSTPEDTAVDLPTDMTKAEAIKACERTAERDNSMSELAERLLDRL